MACLPIPDGRRDLAEPIGPVDDRGQLARLDAKQHLSTDEEVERKRLQKLKLAGKDRMMEILYRYRTEESPQH